VGTDNLIHSLPVLAGRPWRHPGEVEHRPSTSHGRIRFLYRLRNMRTALYSRSLFVGMNSFRRISLTGLKRRRERYDARLIRERAAEAARTTASTTLKPEGHSRDYAMIERWQGPHTESELARDILAVLGQVQRREVMRGRTISVAVIRTPHRSGRPSRTPPALRSEFTSHSILTSERTWSGHRQSPQPWDPPSWEYYSLQRRHTAERRNLRSPTGRSHPNCPRRSRTLTLPRWPNWRTGSIAQDAGGQPRRALTFEDWSTWCPIRHAQKPYLWARSKARKAAKEVLPFNTCSSPAAIEQASVLTEICAT